MTSESEDVSLAPPTPAPPGGPPRSLRVLQKLLAVAAVVLLFSNLAGYAFEALGGPRPLYPIAIVCALALALVVLQPGQIEELLRSPLSWWAAAYLAISSLWMTGSEAVPGAWQSYADRLRSTALLLTGLVIFSASSGRRWAQWALAGLVLGATSLNVVDVLAPLTFSNVAGRSAGLYINPNGSGFAIVFALALCLRGVREPYRVPLFLAGSLGVLMTLSRGAMILFLVLAIWLVASRQLSARRTLIATLLLVAAVAVLGGIRDVGDALDTTGLIGDLASDRLRLGASDYSADDRRAVASQALALFEDAPALGRGLGTSLSWDDQSSHNFFLNMAVDHGVVGLALVVLLLLALWSCGPAARLVAILVAASCFFSHNVLDAEYELLSMAFAAAAGAASRSELAPRAEVRPV